MLDPITATSLAANVAQFAVMAVHIGQRIKRYATLQVEIPNDLQDIVRRLDLVNDCLSRIREDLKERPALYGSETLRVLDSFLCGMSQRCRQLETILENYLPKGDDPSLKRVQQALSSVAKDKNIAAVAKKLEQDSFSLILHQVTRSLKGTDQRTENVDDRLNGRFFYEVPYSRAQNFVMRDELLSRLRSMLDFGDYEGPRVAILQGMGGQGKTQIALEYCRQSKREKRYSGVFWVDAAETSSTARGFEVISDCVKANNQIFTDSDARIAYVRRTLSEWTEPWLLVFDNYDDPTKFDLCAYFPISTKGHIIITTRNPDTGRIGELIEVSGMSEKQALELLFTQCGIPQNNESESHGQSVVRRLGYLPLAISQCGSFLRERRDILSLKDFLLYYERYTKEVLEAAPTISDYLRNTGSGQQQENAKTVFTTWNMSYQLLKPDTERGAKLSAFLSLLAYFDENDISEELFSVYVSKVCDSRVSPTWVVLFTDKESRSWSGKNFQDLMLDFRRLSLIASASRKEDNFVHVSLHPLVKDWIKLRQDIPAILENIRLASEVLVCSMLQSYWFRPETMYAGFRLPITKQRQYLAHLSSWEAQFLKYNSFLRPTPVDVNKHSKPAAIEQIFADFYQDFGYLENSLQLSRWIWDHCDPAHEAGRHMKLHAGFQSCETLGLLRRLDESESMARECLQYFSHHSADDNGTELSVWRLVQALNDFHFPEKSVEGEALCRSMIRTLQQSDVNPIRLHAHLIELGYALYIQGRTEEANTICERVVSETETVGGSNFRTQSWTYRMWAFTCFHPNIEIRDKLSLEFIEAMTQWYGHDHFLHWGARGYRAEVLVAKGDYCEAERVIYPCVLSFRTAPPRDGLRERACQTYGEALAGQSRNEEAMQAYSEAYLGLCENTHIASIVEVLRKYGSVAMDIGRLSEAEIAYRTVLDIAMAKDWTSDCIVNALVGLGIVTWRLGDRTRDQAKLLKSIQLLNCALGFYYRSPSDSHLESLFRSAINGEQRSENGDMSYTLLSMDGIVDDAIPKAENNSYLFVEIGGWFGFHVMLKQAALMTVAGDVEKTECLFRTALAAFENVDSLSGSQAECFILDATTYRDFVFQRERDRQRVLDFLDWAESQAEKRLSNDEKRKVSCLNGLDDLRKLLSNSTEDESTRDGHSHATGSTHPPPALKKPTIKQQLLPLRWKLSKHKRGWSMAEAMESVTRVATSAGTKNWLFRRG